MKILKHNTKDKYVFINDLSRYIEYFTIEKFKNKLATDIFSLSEKSDIKAFQKFKDKLLKKGFEEFEISKEIQAKTDQLTSQFELSKDHYFIEKNKNDILNSNLVLLSLSKNGDHYNLKRISTENEDQNDDTVLSTLNNFVLGFVPSERDELTPQKVAPELNFYLNLLFILGFEQQTMEQLTSLCLPKPITKDTLFEGDILEYKKSSQYIKVAPNYDLNCIQITDYKIENKIITNKIVSYSIAKNEKQLEEILKFFKDEEKFEPLKEADFQKKFEEKLTINFFEKPALKKSVFPKFPLHVPEDIIEIDNFFDNIIEENKYYFFANTTSEDPMDWQVAFISCADKKEDWYVYTSPFLLKDFNKNIRKQKETELSYSSDRSSFIKKRKKAFKKVGLKAIATKTIFEALSGKSMDELDGQKQITSFVNRSKENVLFYDIFDNYACVRENSLNHLYWQFFKNANERENWLKKYQTKETKLFDDENNFILKHTNHYLTQNNSDIVKLRKSYIKNPILKRIFSDSYDINKFTKSKLVFQEGKQIKGDYLFSSKNASYSVTKTIIIEGDLIVDGTLFFDKNNDNYIIIKGDLKAKNLIVNSNCTLIHVEGNTEIENITKSYFRFTCEKAKTKILLHTYKEVLDLKTNFSYSNEVSFFSNAITNKEIIKKNRYNSLEWDVEKIYELLINNKAFLLDKIENTKIDYDEYYKNKFEGRMQDWGYFYPEYAGCEQLGISEDNEIKGNCIYPGGGDWVVNDLRGKSGTYGVSHDDYSICKLKVKNPSKFNIDYKQKPIKLKLDAEGLMNRYISISMLYMNWAHRTSVSFTSDDKSKSKTFYENEKTAFVEDPYLALYWLNHFGASLDKRYDEVLTIVEENNLVEKLPILKEPIAFFKKTDAFYDYEIQGGYSSNKKDFKDLFLKRRSYLVYWEHVYKNYNPDNLDLWWKSITIYPKIEENLIQRMRWLKNNLNKCENWSDFDLLIKNESKEIPLLSYVLACNPNTSKKEKTKYADILVAELFEHRNYFKTPHKKSFAEILLWDVHEFVSNREKLQEVAQFYFKGNEISKEYQDIQAVFGIKNENLDEVKSTLEKLNQSFEGYDRFDTPAKEKQKYHQNIIAILDELEPKILLETAKNLKNHELAKRYFVYLWNANVPNKKDALIQLFIHIEFSGHNISKEIFGDNFPNLIKDENDPNIEIVKALLTIPEADFRNDSMWENSKEAASKFFLTTAHLPNIFEFLIETVQQKPTKENAKIIDAVYTTLFSNEYESKINPTLKFSKSQIETMLQTICDWFLKYGYQAEGYRSIYYCCNPLAEEWIKDKYNNKTWLQQFAHISTFYDPLNEELNDALKSALEFIGNQKHYAYLEFKDEKSHKYWEISHYGSGFNVTYGKAGTEGKKSEKSFDSEEEAFKAGDKLIASKLKKGYKKVDK